jgi:ABC-type uncharacterized transport system substrate-binding protein
VNAFVSLVESKRLGLLRALVSGVKVIAVILNPKRQQHAEQWREVEEAAHAIGRQINLLLASNRVKSMPFLQARRSWEPERCWLVGIHSSTVSAIKLSH